MAILTAAVMVIPMAVMATRTADTVTPMAVTTATHTIMDILMVILMITVILTDTLMATLMANTRLVPLYHENDTLRPIERASLDAHILFALKLRNMHFEMSGSDLVTIG